MAGALKSFNFSTLTLHWGKYNSALAYYSDHQEEIDRVIERQLEDVDWMREVTQPTPLAAKLKAKSLIY